MIIFRYLVKEVYGTVLASTVVLLLLLISNQFVHYLAQAAAGVLPLRTVMQIMSLQVPLLLGLLIPLGLYLGILMAYGRLYVDREMTVLFACGLSKAQLIGMTLLFSFAISVVVGALMLWIEPTIESYKRAILMDAASASPMERVSPGQFIEVPDRRMYFYAQNLSHDHKQLQNIFIASSDKPDAKTHALAWNVVVAANAEQNVDPKTHDKFLTLNNGYRYLGVPGQANFQIAQYGNYAVRLTQNSLTLGKGIEAISTLQLWRQRHTHPTYRAELQWRFALPLSVFVLALLAVPLSRVDPRQGRYGQLLPAFLLYIVYADLMFMGRAWMQKGKISPDIGMWWVHGLMFSIAIVLLVRYIGFARILRLLKLKPESV